MKQCTLCKESKPFEAFYNRKASKDGHSPHCIPCHKGKAAERRATPEYKVWKKNRSLVYKYGITLDEYNDMHYKQRGTCAICEKPEPIKTQPLAVDHCHDTGKVRGLLCSNCNMGIGKLMDDEKIILKAAEYISSALY